jgi:hypothetical protein
MPSVRRPCHAVRVMRDGRAPGHGLNGASRTASSRRPRDGDRFLLRVEADGEAPECPYHPGSPLYPIGDPPQWAMCWLGCRFEVTFGAVGVDGLQ